MVPVQTSNKFQVWKLIYFLSDLFHFIKKGVGLLDFISLLVNHKWFKHCAFPVSSFFYQYCRIEEKAYHFGNLHKLPLLILVTSKTNYSTSITLKCITKNYAINFYRTSSHIQIGKNGIHSKYCVVCSKLELKEMPVMIFTVHWINSCYFMIKCNIMSRFRRFQMLLSTKCDFTYQYFQCIVSFMTNPSIQHWT